MNRNQIEGQLLAVFILYPFFRLLFVRWARFSARGIVSKVKEETVRHWAVKNRLGRFTCACLCGFGCGGGLYPIIYLFNRIAGFTQPPSLGVAVFPALFMADWAAQIWSAREARISNFLGLHPLPDVLQTMPSAVPEERPPVASAPVGLFTGLGILGAVFAFVLALATYRDNLKAPATVQLPAEGLPAPAVPRLAERVPVETPPPVIGAVATSPPETKRNLTPSYQNVDFSAVIEQMNDEANHLMPYALPLPIPDDQLQDLTGKFQKMATRYFSDLGVRDSPLNREFVVRYKQRQAETPAFFDQPDWPVRLTIECVDLLTAGKPTPQDPPAAAE